MVYPTHNDPRSLRDYRDWRAFIVAEIRAHRVGGDLVRHCETHREIQTSLSDIRLHFAKAR